MFRFLLKNFQSFLKNVQRNSIQVRKYQTNGEKTLPAEADVVIVGGGVAGCYTLYHLAKRGIQAVLLERFQLTSGTTWHTNGLMWRIRPNDTDIQLLNRTRDVVKDIKENSEYDPGFIENGGIFIARNQTRLDEYKRLATIAKVYNIEHLMLTVDETLQLCPILNEIAFIGSLYSPGDGIIDPTQLCNALTKLAVKTSNAQIFENCTAIEIMTEQCTNNELQKIVGLKTNRGEIKTKCLVNATGAWGRDLIEPFGITLPLIPMKHSYVVSEPVATIQSTKLLPNIRDHDSSIVFRVQGSSLYLGGYERNPILLDAVPNDFRFSLYDLDWSTFDDHIDAAVELCPAFGQAGIKCTICGPETFTPDHKPIIGADPRLIGLFHNCGYNSAGMMFGGGCGEQLAEWIIHGRPEFYMYNFDIRRFTANQMANKQYAIERCHEAYAENYAAVFAHNQPLAGRKFQIDSLHDELCSNAGAIMEEKSGWERPAFFYKEKAPINIPTYDWYGAYGYAVNSDKAYVEILKGDQTYNFSQHHDRIGAEAISCRTAAAVFNLSSFCKLLISGPDAKAALAWICTNDVDQPTNKTVYTCALNNRGGVEAHFTVTTIKPTHGDHVIGSNTNESTYYVVADGTYANQTLAHINKAINEQKFDVKITDLTEQLGILSIQGPNSRKILEEFTEMNLHDDILPAHKSISSRIKCLNSKAVAMHVMRNSFVGKLGYELHVASKNCLAVYKKLHDIGQKHGLKDAGFRAYNSLNCEAGFHLWGYDLRSDDTPIEANLDFVCRQNDVPYQGSDIVKKQQMHGVRKRLAMLTLKSKVPIWGLEGVYCNGNAVGYLRRAEFGYSINKPIGKAFINLTERMTDDWRNGEYEIDVLGNRYAAEIHTETPFKCL